MPVTPLELARVAALAADSKKASDIVLIDLTSKTDVCDYFLICTGSNPRQVDAIVDEVREKVHTNCGISPISCEGRQALSWVLVDWGSVVLHAFAPEARAYYRLERLWGDAPRVHLGLEGEMDEEGVASAPEELPQFDLDPEDLVDNLPESSDPVE